MFMYIFQNATELENSLSVCFPTSLSIITRIQSVHLWCVFLVCGRKMEYLEKTHAGRGGWNAAWRQLCYQLHHRAAAASSPLRRCECLTKSVGALRFTGNPIDFGNRGINKSYTEGITDMINGAVKLLLLLRVFGLITTSPSLCFAEAIII